MPKAPATTTSLPPPRRVFEPARYCQQHLASAYLQLVPSPRRRIPVSPPLALPTSAAWANVAS
jgi:hypothetical protein